MFPSLTALMALDTDGTSLNQLFGRAAALVWSASEPWQGFEYLALREGEPLPPRAPSAEDAAAAASEAALTAVFAIAEAANAAGVISRNDAIDDISTRSLRFLFLPFMEANASAAWQGLAERRLQRLLDAKRALQEFFDQMDRLELLSRADRAAVFDDVPETSQTPQQKRDTLVARHKAEKVAIQTMTALLERLKTSQSVHALKDDDNDASIDEDSERAGLLTVLQSAVRRGLDCLRSFQREMDVLEYKLKMQADGRDPAEEARRARTREPPKSKSGLPSTFRIVNKREEAMKGVFRPDTSIPTYTVEEWGQIEMQRAAEMEKEKRREEQLQAHQAADVDSDGDEAADRMTYEKRRWDNWKDEHNKGSGNTLR